MEKRGHFPRKTAGLLALLLALTIFAAGCGDTKEPDQPDKDPSGEKPTDIVLVEPEAVEVPVDFETAQEAWPNAYAYIKIPNANGCAIREGNFIAQHPTDDGYYLYRDLDGKDNKAGTLYTEASYNDTDMEDPVTVVYGHNMANRTMFGGLQSYAETLKFDDKAVVEVYQRGRRMTPVCPTTPPTSCTTTISRMSRCSPTSSRRWTRRPRIKTTPAAATIPTGSAPPPAA